MSSTLVLRATLAAVVVSVMAVQCSEAQVFKFNRSEQLDAVYNGMKLLKLLVTANPDIVSNDHDWFLPDASNFAGNIALRKEIEDLLALMKKKEELEILYGDIVLREVMEVIEKVMDDACSHINQTLPENINCDNSTEVELLLDRLTVAETIIGFEDFMVDNYDRRSSTFETRCTYWEEKVACSSNSNIVELGEIDSEYEGRCICP